MRTILLAALLSLLAWPGLAADGDLVSRETKGATTEVIYKLCDGETGGATKQCTVFDLRNAAGPNLYPDVVGFSFALDTGCAGATTVMPQGSDESDLNPRYDLAASVLADPGSGTAGEGFQYVTPHRQLSNRYLTADIQVGTGCTDAEVWIKLIYFIR